MAREGLLKRCPDELYGIILRLADAAVDIDIHAKLFQTSINMRIGKQLTDEGNKHLNQLFDEFIRLYIPDHESTDGDQLARMTKQLAEAPEIIRVRVGETMGEAFEIQG